MTDAKKEKKRHARAQDDVRRGLARRDAKLAVDGLAQLPGVLRDEHLPAVSALVVNDIARYHRAGEWTDLARLGSAAQSVPGLLEGALSPEAAANARWSILWGHCLSGAMAQARATWLEIEPMTASRDESLARAVTAFLDADGAPTGDGYARFERAAAELIDPRLGVEAKRSAPPRPPCPSAPDEVSSSVAGAFAVLSWREFAMTLKRWLSDGPVQIRSCLLDAAAEISFWEAERRCSTRRDDALEPLLLWAHCAQLATEAPEGSAVIAAQAIDAVRVALAATTEPCTEQQPRTVAQIIGAAVAVAECFELVVEGLTASDRDGDFLVPLLSGLQENRPDARLWWAEASAIVKRRIEASDQNSLTIAMNDLERLHRGFKRSVEPGSAALVRCCEAAKPSEVAKVCALVSDLFSCAEVATFVETLWDGLAVDARREIAASIRIRLDVGEPYYCGSCERLHDATEGFSTAETLLWFQLGERLARYDIELLIAWVAKRSGPEVATALASYLEGEPLIEGWLEVLAYAGKRKLRTVRDKLLERMVICFADDLDSLAQVVLTASALPAVRARASKALVAGTRAPSRPLSPLVVRALARVERESARTRRKPRAARPALRQISLPSTESLS